MNFWDLPLSRETLRVCWDWRSVAVWRLRWSDREQSSHAPHYTHKSGSPGLDVHCNTLYFGLLTWEGLLRTVLCVLSHYSQRTDRRGSREEGGGRWLLQPVSAVSLYSLQLCSSADTSMSLCRWWCCLPSPDIRWLLLVLNLLKTNGAKLTKIKFSKKLLVETKV